MMMGFIVRLESLWQSVGIIEAISLAIHINPLLVPMVEKVQEFLITYEIPKIRV